LLWPDRFILERLAGLMFVSTNAFQESVPTAVGIAEMTGGGPRAHRIRRTAADNVGTARARKMNPVKVVSKEVAAGGKCR
jgi:hypothetical protein